MSERQRRALLARSRLAALGRRNYVTMSGLEMLIKELREVGIPECASRSSIKRARDEVIAVETGYGPLFQRLPLWVGGKDI
eukprot:10669621-Karenia_brevis.AAC.1